jgi:glycosyltransferase involved in cell wall biosynthesis
MIHPSTLLIIGALPSSLVNFRGPLIQALLARGHRVVATANGRDAATEKTLAAWGVEYHANKIRRAGTSPLDDVRAFSDLVRLIRRVRPDRVLAYTIKPVVYGGLAARCCGVPGIYSMIEGLGRAFMPRESLLHGVSSIMARALYRIGLPGSACVFFLNPDDIRQFIAEGFVRPEKTVLLNGIGIDLDHYRAAPVPPVDRVRFLMVARLLRDKGVREFVGAAEAVIASGPCAEFVLAGELDDNPSSVREEELESWRQTGTVRYAGRLDDVRPAMRESHVYVLPSYREGTPRTVLEAMSTGRPLITTDAPGCRETVRPMPEDQRTEIGARLGGGTFDEAGWLRIGALKVGSNGVLVPVRDVDALVRAMRLFIDHPELIARMGRESRRYAEERYDVHKVNAAILSAMGLGGGGGEGQSTRGEGQWTPNTET